MLLNDITGVTVNYCHARETIGAIESVRKFYPDLSIVVGDDYSGEAERGNFYSYYNGHDLRPDLTWDIDTDKIAKLPNVILAKRGEKRDGPWTGCTHGHAVDEALKHVATIWFFHFHPDYRLTKPGLLEELMEGVDETYCAIGDSKIRHNRCMNVVSVAAVYNAKAGREHNITYKPVIYYDDDTIDPYPGPIDPNKKGGIAIEAGSYYVGKLYQLGYKIKWVATPHERYGVHMRWTGDEEAWNKLF